MVDIEGIQLKSASDAAILYGDVVRKVSANHQ